MIKLEKKPSHRTPLQHNLRHTLPGYNSYNESFGVVKDKWNVLIFDQNLLNLAEVPLRPQVLGVKVGIQR